MSRKSNKGFKRLENHELTEFTTLNGGAGDSESEDLLDLTGGDEHETRDRCYRYVSAMLKNQVSKYDSHEILSKHPTTIWGEHLNYSEYNYSVIYA